tara:strand:+ start:733 stop:1170 length:438 start_codon:yes stop_codon:yes gene_type:complete
MRDNHQSILKNKSPFGRYDEALAGEIIRISTLSELDKKLDQLVSKLYPEYHQFSFEIAVPNDVSYYSDRKVSINVSPDEWLHDYLQTKVTPTYTFEQVQLSGRELADIQNAEQLSERRHKHAFLEKVTCYSAGKTLSCEHNYKSG